MSASEPIVLYQCKDCRSQVFTDQIESGQSCAKCGSRYVSIAPPTFRYILGYLWHHGKIMRFLFENVLMRQRVIG